MPNTIQLKRNATSGAVPSGAALAAGEPAVNTADGRLFVKTSAGNVVDVSDPVYLTAQALPGSTNNWNPGTYGDIIRVSTAFNAVNITGLVSTYANRAVTIINSGFFNITLTVADPASSVANRFYHPSLTGYVIGSGLMVSLLYDPTLNSGSGAWRIIDNSLDGNRGDITVSGGGNSFSINAGAVTTSKVLNGNVTVEKLAPQPYTTYTTQALSSLLGNMVAITAATTITVPTDATAGIAVGARVDFLQTTAGQLTLVGASGVTLQSAFGLKTRTQWSVLSLLKIAANQWVVFGDTVV